MLYHSQVLMMGGVAISKQEEFYHAWFTRTYEPLPRPRPKTQRGQHYHAPTLRACYGERAWELLHTTQQNNTDHIIREHHINVNMHRYPTHGTGKKFGDCYNLQYCIMIL